MTNNDGRRLRVIREAAGYSQAELARLLNDAQGVTTWMQTSVAKVEGGERILTLEVLRAYSRIFGLTVDQLTSGDAATLNDALYLLEHPAEQVFEAAWGAELRGLRAERSWHLLQIAEIDQKIQAKVDAADDPEKG